MMHSDHDHGGCVASALKAAEEVCRERGARLTGLRRRVLELVWGSHRPVGAYALCDMLSEKRRTAPATVYRALDFLLEQGLVHRVASLNAFVGCVSPRTAHAGHFLICGTCRESLEICDSNVEDALRETASRAGFDVRSQTVEMVGTCTKCRKAPG